MKPYQKYEIVEFWCALLGIGPASEGQIGRYNQSLKFCIFDERNGKHNRSHIHALLNGNKVASIYLDNLEIDFLSSRIKQSDKNNNIIFFIIFNPLKFYYDVTFKTIGIKICRIFFMIQFDFFHTAII